MKFGRIAPQSVISCWINSSISLFRPCSRYITTHVTGLRTRYLLTRGPPMAMFHNKKGEGSSLRHVKYQAKHRGGPRPASVIDVQVVGTGYAGNPRVLSVSMDHFRYLFNCGEGAQRISSEHKMKISKIQSIFITRKNWDNLGGLLGMCLSLEAVGVPGVVLHGPPNVEKLVTMSKGIGQLHTIRIEKRDLSTGFYEDSAMKIDYIVMDPNQTDYPQSVTEEEKLAEGPDLSTITEKQKLAEGPDLSAVTEKEKLADLVVAYLCRPHPKERSVSLEKCVDIGISSGPMIGQLKKGESVTLADGRVIMPDDILNEADPNHPFLVLECPSEDHFESFLKNDIVKKMQDPLTSSSPCLIIHMTPQDLLMNPKYQTWINSFPDLTKHLILNETCSGPAFEGVYRIQDMLNLLHQEIFPSIADPYKERLSDVQRVNSENNMVYGETNLKYVMRGKNNGKVFRDQCINLDREAFRQEALEQTDFPELLSTVKQQLEQHSVDDGAAPYPELLFLGTGSSIPSKVRNVSGIWVNLREDQAILLDCGENSLGQLYRHYGQDQAKDMLQKLSTIFVSHLHADHHLGVTSFAKAREQVLRERGLEVSPLVVVAPIQLEHWYQNLDAIGLSVLQSVRVLPVEVFYKNRPAECHQLYDEVVKQLNMKQIEVVRVIHRQMPHGVILTHSSGWKLAYSGDTIPCPRLVEAGKGCDVLIHEATMDDGLEEEAAKKKHSTTSQAIQVGMDMEAKFILLTHFSQRYAKVPLFNDNFSNRVGIAFDNMRVKLHQLPLLPYLLPALKAMFAEDYAEMEERSLKTTYKKKYGAGVDTDDIDTKKQKTNGQSFVAAADKQTIASKNTNHTEAENS